MERETKGGPVGSSPSSAPFDQEYFRSARSRWTASSLKSAEPRGTSFQPRDDMVLVLHRHEKPFLPRIFDSLINIAKTRGVQSIVIHIENVGWTDVDLFHNLPNRGPTLRERLLRLVSIGKKYLQPRHSDRLEYALALLDGCRQLRVATGATVSLKNIDLTREDPLLSEASQFLRSTVRLDQILARAGTSRDHGLPADFKREFYGALGRIAAEYAASIEGRNQRVKDQLGERVLRHPPREEELHVVLVGAAHRHLARGALLSGARRLSSVLPEALYEALPPTAERVEIGQTLTRKSMLLLREGALSETDLCEIALSLLLQQGLVQGPLSPSAHPRFTGAERAAVAEFLSDRIVMELTEAERRRVMDGAFNFLAEQVEAASDRFFASMPTGAPLQSNERVATHLSESAWKETLALLALPEKKGAKIHEIVSRLGIVLR